MRQMVMLDTTPWVGRLTIVSSSNEAKHVSQLITGASRAERRSLHYTRLLRSTRFFHSDSFFQCSFKIVYYVGIS